MAARPSHPLHFIVLFSLALAAPPDTLNQFHPVEFPSVQPANIEGATMTSNLFTNATVDQKYTAVFGGQMDLDLSLCNVGAKNTNDVWLLKQDPPSTWHKCEVSNNPIPSIRYCIPKLLACVDDLCIIRCVCRAYGMETRVQVGSNPALFNWGSQG
jgi:hypothetical protein